MREILGIDSLFSVLKGGSWNHYHLEMRLLHKHSNYVTVSRIPQKRRFCVALPWRCKTKLSILRLLFWYHSWWVGESQVWSESLFRFIRESGSLFKIREILILTENWIRHGSYWIGRIDKSRSSEKAGDGLRDEKWGVNPKQMRDVVREGANWNVMRGENNLKVDKNNTMQPNRGISRVTEGVEGCCFGREEPRRA